MEHRFMSSLTPYHLPALIFTLLSISAVVYGGWIAYTAFPEGPKYQYTVDELDDSESASDLEVIQFTDLSESSQEVFLTALDDGRYNTDQKVPEINYVTDVPVKNYVVYQHQTYVFIGNLNYASWWQIGLYAGVGIALLGLIATGIGILFVEANQFKIPAAVSAGVLVLGFLAVLIRREFLGGQLEQWAILPLVLLSTWFLLWGIEQKWNMSFSQRMDQ